MADSTVLNSFRRYKADTERVKAWLLTASRYTGGGDVPTSLLPELAKKVSPEKIPDGMVKTLDNVIQARKECAAHFKSKIEQQASNDRHEHFTRTLEEVRRSLDCSCPAPAKTSMPTQTSGATTLKNRFEHLELQEPAEWDDHIVKALRGKQQLVSAEDDIFAPFCFLMDYHRIAQWVKSIWGQYRSKKASLNLAALTTNLAFDNIKRLHDNLIESYPKYSSYEALMRFSFDDFKLGEVRSPGNIWWALQPGHEAYGVLSLYLKIYESGCFADFDPNEDFEYSSSRSDATNIIKLLQRSIPDMLCYFWALIDVKGPFDELSFALSKLFNSHELTVPLVLSCNIFGDVYLKLREETERPFLELQTAAKNAELWLARQDIYHEILKADHRSEITKAHMGSIRTLVDECVKTDLAYDYRLQRVPESPGTTHTKSTPFNMLKHHPVLCGMLQFYLDGTKEFVGLRFCDESQCFLKVLHLYYAVKAKVPSWTDMETIVSLFGKRRLFMGDPPTRPKEQMKRNQQVHGVFTRCSRDGRLHLQTGKPLLIASEKPFLDVLRSRWARSSGKKESAVVLKDVEMLLKTSTGEPQSTLKKRALRQWKLHKKLDPVNMLNLVAEGIREEELQLNFDFLSMNRRCMEFLRHLRDRLAKVKPPDHWSDAMARQISKTKRLASHLFGSSMRSVKTWWLHGSGKSLFRHWKKSYCVRETKRRRKQNRDALPDFLRRHAEQVASDAKAQSIFRVYILMSQR